MRCPSIRSFASPLLALSMLVACGPSVPRLAPLEPDAIVLAFGDSLTFGTGASEAESYPAVLAALIGRKVVRAGVPGEVSAAGLARLPSVLDEHSPKLLILCHGGNDFLRKYDDERTAGNVRAMARHARERGIAVVLLSTPKLGLGVVVPKFYAEIGKELGIPVETQVLETVLLDKSLKSDLVHPNATGYRKLAEAVAALLRKAGAL